MAGTATITEEVFGSVKKISWTWASNSDGDAGGSDEGLTSNIFNGVLQRLTTVPSTTSPTDNYDIVINDEDGTDVLMGGGANRDTTVTEQVLASSLGAVANDKLDLVVSNAGDTKGGTVHLYLR